MDSIEADPSIHSIFGALRRFRFDFSELAFIPRLRKRYARDREKEQHSDLAGDSFGPSLLADIQLFESIRRGLRAGVQRRSRKDRSIYLEEEDGPPTGLRLRRAVSRRC
jgi:hypothetical protein